MALQQTMYELIDQALLCIFRYSKHPPLLPMEARRVEVICFPSKKKNLIQSLQSKMQVRFSLK